ncbi:MAG: ATP-dependent DNA helicase RecQ [Gemmatimonadaceae bacterium]|nr:ATP-dependent DNA helicase RecQ [Gemmatimonadaceae bacterium]
MLSAPTIDDARAVLQARFGYGAFRPGQERAIQSIIAGRDTLVVLPTGGGKSLCYQVPALISRGLTVVISPLISLMKDQVDALERRGIPAAFINSTLSSAEVSDRMMRAQRGDIKMLYVAPERFDVGATAERLKAIGIAMLAVDEAHCISEWGHDFRPSYRRVGEVRQRLGNPPTIALTATATPVVREDIARILDLKDPEIIVTGFDRPNLSYGVIAAKGDREKDAVVVDLLRTLEDGTGIVYASTRKTVERLAQYLDDQGIPASAYHAGLDDERRRRVQDYFMSERTRVIVATNSFGMGVDKSNVRLVVHYTMPGTLEAYYQEAGRAGRDGLHSNCYLLHAFPDRFTHEFFIKSALPDRALIEQVHRRCQREADRGGVVAATADELAGGIGGKVSSKAVESALRVLADASVLRWDPESAGLVSVRLLATPERIKDELGGADSEMERELLRACWRVAKSQLARGAIIDLDGLPPGFGGFSGSFPMLESLQARQFVQVERVGGGLRLVDPAMSLDRTTIDWRAIDRRRQRESDKLEAMQRYAYASTCRRQALLLWFGDPAARAECGACDNCLGETRSAPAVRSVWSGDAGRSRASRDPNARRDTQRKSKEKGGTVTEADTELFLALKACRAALAARQQVPAYVVFPDATLAGFASQRPLTTTAMAGVPGVGPVKLERYAAPFLDVIRSHGR